MKHFHPHGDASKCALCGNRIPFDPPKELYEDVVNGRVVVFAGAGVSTESRLVFPYTLYEDVCQELSIRPSKGLSFPDVMTKYCAQPNGRTKLLQKIRSRFAYIRSFPELYRWATRFHCELSTIHLLDTIITTNWDDYFESECSATPFVTAEDFAFWSVPGRKVFKLHGSVNSYGSIVATRKDYETCYKRLRIGLLGSSLKMMLATKTVIYFGFSFKDPDFLRVQKLLASEMRGLMPQSYIVTPERLFHSRYTELGIVPIYTDATYFLEMLKTHLVKKKIMLGDDKFGEIMQLLAETARRHFELADKVNLRETPEAIFALCYQDGAMHAFERMLALKSSGYYSNACNALNAVRSYEEIRKQKQAAHKYSDVAYIDGYIDGHMCLLATKQLQKQRPRYYIYGRNTSARSLREYTRALAQASRFHRAASKWAHMAVKRLIAEDGSTVFHHTPFLL